MAILELDIGNTRLKWRVIAQNVAQPVAYLAVSDEDWVSPQASENLFQRLKSSISARAGAESAGLAINRIRVVSVRAESVNQALAHGLSSVFNVEPEFAKTASETAGVRNSYRFPEEMGADRWSAVVAAAIDKRRNKSLPCCVVDAGSAVTIECIDLHGSHMRGFILPGFRMQVRSLLGETDKVAATDALAKDRIEMNAAAVNTVESVAQGVTLNILAAVDAALAMLNQADGSSREQAPLLIFTGGDAARLASCGREMFDWNIVEDEALVLDGLAYLLPG